MILTLILHAFLIPSTVENSSTALRQLHKVWLKQSLHRRQSVFTPASPIGTYIRHAPERPLAASIKIRLTLFCSFYAWFDYPVHIGKWSYSFSMWPEISHWTIMNQYNSSANQGVSLSIIVDCYLLPFVLCIDLMVIVARTRIDLNYLSSESRFDPQQIIIK